MKITSFIIRTLCAGTVGSLACQAAMQAYADDVPSTFVEGNYSPEVARYVQSIAGVALASGIHDYDENATNSYQVLVQVLNSGNVTNLPDDLDRAALPRHVAVLADGNRRWARQFGTSTEEGHRAGDVCPAHPLRRPVHPGGRGRGVDGHGAPRRRPELFGAALCPSGHRRA